MDHLINQEAPSASPAQPEIKSAFEEMLFAPHPGHAGDFMWSVRHANLVVAVKKRVGKSEEPDRKLSGRFVIEQAAARYFDLIADAHRNMRGQFTEQEFQTILNTTCGPIWEWDTYMSVASMVADDFGVSKLESLAEGSGLRVLLEKLLKLTPIENVAIVDTCERFWRGHVNNLLEEEQEEEGGEDFASIA